jgi:hypothetical protein
MMFATLVHADWSVHGSKRWAASARRRRGGWTVFDLSGVGANSHHLDRLFDAAAEGPVLAGFDFPIGLPQSYGRRTDQARFADALGAFGTGRWARFYDVGVKPSDISVERPFYPRRADTGARQIDLLRGHGVETIDALRRRCELRTPVRRAACPLFWTVGPNQVGKAAITGWREIIVPARQRGARIWPFDGALRELAQPKRVVMAETYPAEAYHHVDAGFARQESKRRAQDRAHRAFAIFDWAADRGVAFAPSIRRSIENGCGIDRLGEDRFDALLGLLAMIEVVAGRRSDGAPDDADVQEWEGWILGQAP